MNGYGMAVRDSQCTLFVPTSYISQKEHNTYTHTEHWVATRTHARMHAQDTHHGPTTNYIMHATHHAQCIQTHIHIHLCNAHEINHGAATPPLPLCPVGAAAAT